MKIEEENDIIEHHTVLLQLAKKITKKNFPELKPEQQSPISMAIYNNIIVLLRQKGLIESHKALERWASGTMSSIIGGNK